MKSVLRLQDIKEIDWPLLVLMLCIVGIGLAALYSASFGRLPELPLRQCIWVLTGIFLFMLSHKIGYRRYINAAYFLYALGILLLLIVLVTGSRKFGAQRWLYVGPLSFQPSELMKLCYLLALARVFSHFEPRELTALDIGFVVCLTLLPMALILVEPDLGTSLIFLPLFLGIFYVWGVNLRFLSGCALLGLAAAPVMWFNLKEYQRSRLLAFFDPNADPLGAGYTMIQSKIAIGSGGLFGKGWLSGTQNILNFLPERHSDFIFSVIGEEFGFLGSLVTMTLFFLLTSRILVTTLAKRDREARMVGAGVFLLFLVQSFINLGMSMGIMPVVGLPLPLMSYGGSHLLVNMVCLGLVSSFRKTV
ncbi:MAG: rod shape-determining protein RodA [Candidatus Omnitrophica bacterium]|nr:rod shape-determining protein RodA [Candidatus Omnitrophota bacterium]